MMIFFRLSDALSHDSLFHLIYYRPQQVISVNTDSRARTRVWDWKHVFRRRKRMKDAVRSVDSYLLFH